MATASCRFCGVPLHHTLVDLGMSPLCESYLAADQLNSMEPFYPLHVYVCDRCWLVQLEEYVRPEHIFSEYAYFSSYSTSWCRHAETYTRAMLDRFPLGRQSQVIEIGSNDGYLLQYFVAADIPVLGVEPAANVAETACQKGIPTLVKFFGTETARELVAQGTRGDLLVGNNVLAQIPDINDCVAGLKILLAPGGVITMEFPHLLRLIAGNQFDTIYHEHFHYFSLIAAETIFAKHGLTLFDVEELTTHGGSLRIYARHAEERSPSVQPRLVELRAREVAAGLTRLEYYNRFGEQVLETKRALLDFLIGAKRQGKSIAGYGAPGKGNTLLNYCGIRTDFLDYTVDRNPYKQGKFLPGTHIPIFAPERLKETRPDYVLILPWNLKDEIVAQLSFIQAWSGQLVVPIPRAQIVG
jgi:C-methyltransferase-like protein/putative zinc binding protein/methyltransferase family protein